MTESDHINLSAARSSQQSEQYQAIAESGICPFCPEHYGKFDYQDPPIHESDHWYTINNMNPYPYTQVHNVIIAKRHVQFPNELDVDEWTDFQEVLDYFIRIQKLGYGAVGMRFGQGFETGASVNHLHAHLVQPDPTQTDKDKAVIFYMSRNYNSPADDEND